MCYKAQENELVILHSTSRPLGSTQVDLMLHNSCQRGFGITLLWFSYPGKRFPKVHVIVGWSPGWIQGASGCREVRSLRALPLEGLATIVVRLKFPQEWVVTNGQEWPFISPGSRRSLLWHSSRQQNSTKGHCYGNFSAVSKPNHSSSETACVWSFYTGMKIVSQQREMKTSEEIDGASVMLTWSQHYVQALVCPLVCKDAQHRTSVWKCLPTRLDNGAPAQSACARRSGRTLGEPAWELFMLLV